MPEDENWVDVGHTDEFSADAAQARHGDERRSSRFPSGMDVRRSSNVCNHVGGPLGDGRLDGNYIVCPGTVGNFTV